MINGQWQVSTPDKTHFSIFKTLQLRALDLAKVAYECKVLEHYDEEEKVMRVDCNINILK